MGGVPCHSEEQEKVGDCESLQARLLFTPTEMFHACIQAITIPLAVGGFTVGVLTFGGMEMDPTKPIFVSSYCSRAMYLCLIF